VHVADVELIEQAARINPVIHIVRSFSMIPCCSDAHQQCSSVQANTI
jgi:hypothetical protein